MGGLHYRRMEVEAEVGVVGVAIGLWEGRMEVVRQGHSHGMFLLLLLDTGLRRKTSRGIPKRYVSPSEIC